MEAAVAALNSLETLANEVGVTSEAHLCANLSAVLNLAASKQAKVRSAAESAALAITSKMSPHAVREVLPQLFVASAVGSPWQTRALALKIVALFGDNAPEQLGNALPEVCPYCVSVATLSNFFSGRSSSYYLDD